MRKTAKKTVKLFLAAFAVYFDAAISEIHVRDVQADALGDTDAGP